MAEQNKKVNFTLEQRRVLLSASLVSVIGLISLVNQTLGLRNQAAQSIRGLASDEKYVKFDQGQLQWQRKLARELAKSERDVASLGHKPSAFEQLRFGFFEGKYAFQLEHGKIKAFVDLAVNDAILIKGIRVMQGKDGLFVSMPSEQGKDERWYERVRCLTRNVKGIIEAKVLDTYQAQDNY